MCWRNNWLEIFWWRRRVSLSYTLFAWLRFMKAVSSRFNDAWTNREQENEERRWDIEPQRFLQGEAWKWPGRPTPWRHQPRDVLFRCSLYSVHQVSAPVAVAWGICYSVIFSYFSLSFIFTPLMLSGCVWHLLSSAGKERKNIPVGSEIQTTPDYVLFGWCSPEERLSVEFRMPAGILCSRTTSVFHSLLTWNICKCEREGRENNKRLMRNIHRKIMTGHELPDDGSTW